MGLYGSRLAVVAEDEGPHRQIRLQPAGGRLGLLLRSEFSHVDAIAPAVGEVHPLDPASWVHPLGPFEKVYCIFLFSEGTDLDSQEAHVGRSSLKADHTQFDLIRSIADHSQCLSTGQ